MVTLEKQEYRVVIKCLQNGLSCLHGRSLRNYLESAPSGDSLEDDPRCGACEDVTEAEQMVMEHRKITQCEIADRIRLSLGSVATIMGDRFNMDKCKAQCVPRILTPAIKEVSVAC